MQHLNSVNKFIDAYWLGVVSYEATRRLVNEVLHPLVKNTGKIVVLFATHTPVVTLGKRIRKNTLSDKDVAFWRNKNIQVLETDRGGELTYHDQSQLMMYPVVSLHHYKLGVRKFVEASLNAATKMLMHFNIDAYGDVSRPGVWIQHERSGESKKIISCGYRIINGLTDHGLALNVRKIPQEFMAFSPCGLSSGSLTSLSEITGMCLDTSKILETVSREFLINLTNEM